jgi:hypothetical protein
MKLRKILVHLVLIGSMCCTVLIASSEASYVLIPAAAPAIITAPDYADRFQSPSPSALPAQLFLSKEGYLFSFDNAGRRIYHVPSSYVLASPGGDSVPVRFIAAPMVFMHPAAMTVPVAHYAPAGTFIPVQSYILVP